MDDEVAMLDEQLTDALSLNEDLKFELLKMKEEWEDNYPYQTLELALETIRRLATKVFFVFPDDMETAEILQVMEAEISQALEEPEVFYLTD